MDIDSEDYLVQRFRELELTDPLGPFEFDAVTLTRLFENVLSAPR